MPASGVDAAVIAAVLLFLTLLSPSGAPAAPPADFSDTSVVTDLGSPTDIAFLPNGRMLITTQGGTLWTSTGSGKSVAYTVSAICSDFERGLLGVTVDPQFASNSFIYLYYTFNKNGSCAANSPSSPVNRVSRFTFNTVSNTVNGGSETPIVDNMPSPNGNHNAGDVAFGKDGNLYISIGDGGCDLDNSNLCAGQNTNARKENILTGKILRVTRDGGIPAGNPFTGTGTAACAQNGRTSLTRCRETFAWGLRNPFRIAFDPNAAGTRFYINDVGQGTWEEIDNGIAGADYGWNVREGHCANGSTSDCGSPPAGMTNPIFDYLHGSCNSITAGAFVPNGIWPSTYDGVYLFADYTCGRIWRLSGSSRVDFATGPGVISMQFGPSGSTQALYYATYDNGGQVRKILYTGQANRPPVAKIGADKTFGPVPLAVQFNAAGSSDPDGDTLRYAWDFGDGVTSTNDDPKHTFQTEDTFTVSLTVTDGRGGSDTDTIVIDAGNTEPQPTISNPTADATFTVGQQIVLQGSATDTQDGNLPDSALKWTVVLHHDTHTHPFVTNETGNNVEFDAPAPEDLSAATNSYLEIRLTATDSSGLAKTITQNLQPKKIDLTFATNPTGLKVTVEGVDLTGPTTVVAWQGWEIQVDATSPQLSPSGESYLFSSWSDSGAKSHTITTPSSATTYTATFSPASGPTFAPVADSRVREASPTSNYGTSSTLEVDGGSDKDIETYVKFDVSGVPNGISNAELWVYVVSGSANGPAVYAAGNNWTETGINWNNRTARTTGAIDDKGNLPNRAWVKYNVTVNGNGTYTFVLATNSTDGITAYSRQSSTNRPKLVVIPGSGSGDTTSPSVPTDLNATAVSFSRVDLSWTASNDNVAVTGYDIYRDAELLTSVGAVTTYSDTTVAASTAYDYQVRARDAAGNVSALSAVDPVTTPNRTRTFVTEADARVQESSPTSRYGTSNQLRAEGGTDPDIDSYLRFTVTGVSGSVEKATLRVYVPSGSGYGTVDGPAVYTSTNGWTESTITWSNRPPRSTTPHDDKGPLPAGAWVEFDVTSLIAGNGTFTFVLASGSTDYVAFSSREGANPPELVIEYDPAGIARVAEVDPIPTATPTATATPPATSPRPTRTPEATTQPQPTTPPESTPTATPEPATPEPSPTTEPTATPEPPTPEPTATPTPTAEPDNPAANGDPEEG